MASLRSANPTVFGPDTHSGSSATGRSCKISSKTSYFFNDQVLTPESPPKCHRENCKFSIRARVVSGRFRADVNRRIECCLFATETKQPQKPNILVIMGDDIGWFNPSCYNHGMMGYQTPNIDRIANEGALFNCWYGQQSCTAGRAAFVTGQSPIRTGLTKVGYPRCRRRFTSGGSKRRGTTQAARLCDRAIWEKPLGR